MKGKLQLRKPENWQDFESLCKKLWGEIWECPSTIKKHGRTGQDQYGVDIYALPKGENAYFGIQCKGKDDYTNSQLTIKEIDYEISKALTFTPALKSFYFATTSNKDAKIEAYIRQKNLESIAKGGFSIDIFSWEDIVDLIESNKNTYNWYMHDLPFSDSYKVEIDIRSKSREEPYILQPQFVKRIKKYELKSPLKMHPIWGGIDMNFLNDYQNYNLGYPFSRTTYNYQWCTIRLHIGNFGTLPLEDYKINVSFENGYIDDISSFSGYNDNPLFPDAMRAELSRQAREKQEVFLYNNDDHSLLIKAKKCLIQKDTASFSFAVKPRYGIEKLKITWELKARNFDTKGESFLSVEPIIEDVVSTIWVESEEEIMDDEFVIEAKEVAE